MLLALTAAAVTASVPADLARAVVAYDRATVAADTATLARLVSDDYLLVNSDGSVQRKPSYLADFRMPGFRIDRYAQARRFSRVARDTALTGGELRLGWMQDGRRHARTVRIAHWWVRRAGRWRLSYTQLTRMPGGRGGG